MAGTAAEAEKKPRGLMEIEQADAVFASLAHPARRQILLAVHYRGSARAGEIAERFECSWPTTSRHLATLVRSQLLTVQTIGRERIYRSNSALLQEVLDRWSGYFAESTTRPVSTPRP
jgi:DNA-binding transcriptional ArsR family regulator